MTPLYSDVFEMPSEISDHDAAVAFLKCPKSTSCSFTRKIWFILLTLFLCFLYFKVSLSLPNLKTFFLRRSRSRISTKNVNY
jgi:hypothetical protein